MGALHVERLAMDRLWEHFQPDTRSARRVDRQEDHPSSLQSLLKALEGTGLHAASLSLEAVNGRFSHVGSFSQHSNADAKACARHPNLSRIDHF